MLTPAMLAAAGQQLMTFPTLETAPPANHWMESEVVLACSPAPVPLTFSSRWSQQCPESSQSGTTRLSPVAAVRATGISILMSFNSRRRRSCALKQLCPTTPLAGVAVDSTNSQFHSPHVEFRKKIPCLLARGRTAHLLKTISTHWIQPHVNHDQHPHCLSSSLKYWSGPKFE